jgi:hypothetical protein
MQTTQPASKHFNRDQACSSMMWFVQTRHYLVAVFLARLVGGAIAGAITIEGRIVGITDGDTIRLLDAI